MDSLIFDLGGVLVDWNPRHLYRTLIDDPQEIEDFLAKVCTQSWNEAQDAGRPFAEGVELLAKAFPQHRELIEAYDRRWDEMVAGEKGDTVEILEEIVARMPVFALTNWSAEKFYVAERFDFLRLFEGIVVSGRVGLKKPDPQIYRHTLDRFGLDAQHTAFVDDSLTNVRAAQSLGMTGIHFTDATTLRRDLVAHGFLEH